MVFSHENRTLSQLTLATDKADLSVILARQNASLSLKNVNLVSSGLASQTEESHSTGLNSALLVISGASVSLDGVSIHTSGAGANGGFVSGAGSQLNLQSSQITTRQSGAYGLEARDGAALNVMDTQITTVSDHAPAVAGGPHAHVSLTRGTFQTNGPNSPGLLLSADLTLTGTRVEAGRSEGLSAVGPQSISLTDAVLSGDTYAAKIYGPDDRSGQGDAEPKMIPATALIASSPDHPVSQGALTVTGGRLSGKAAVLYVSNIQLHIVLDHVDMHSEGGIVLRAAAATYGQLGLNGGHVRLDVHHQTLTGDLVTDVVSRISLTLNDSSSFAGRATHNTDVTIDSNSRWDLSADCGVGKLTVAGISSSEQITSPDLIARLASHGHILSYDTLSNPWLGGRRYALQDGGTLQPGL